MRAWSQIAPLLKIFLQKERISQILLLPLLCLSGLIHISICNTKIGEKSDMTKVAIKSEKLSPFGGIFSIMEQFDSNLTPSSHL